MAQSVWISLCNCPRISTAALKVLDQIHATLEHESVDIAAEPTGNAGRMVAIREEWLSFSGQHADHAEVALLEEGRSTIGCMSADLMPPRKSRRILCFTYC
jgi:hypothetical protein